MMRPMMKILNQKGYKSNEEASDENPSPRLVIKIHNQKGYKSHDEASDKNP